MGLVYVFGRKLDPSAFDLSGFPIESSRLRRLRVVLHGVKLRESLSCGSMPYGNEHSVNVSYGTKRSNADRVLVCPQCYLQVVANTGRVLPLITSLKNM